MVKRAVGSGGKEMLSFVLYVVSIPAAFVSPYVSIACYIAVSITWVIPDRRFEHELFEHPWDLLDVGFRAHRDEELGFRS